MQKKTTLLLMIMLCLLGRVFGQTPYSNSPLNAEFITTDYDNFWQQFDKINDSIANPFHWYLANASDGLQPFVDYLDADDLYQMVLNRKADYLKSRPIIADINTKRKKVQATYAAMKYWYPQAVFPPVYFVVGMFSSGGTVSENGLLIGAEMLQSLDGLNGLIAHELIHYQQKIEGDNNLLKQALTEGSADFIGELISGENINHVPFQYGNQHEAQLCKEFVSVMLQADYKDWLYGTSGKDDRPNDLGYWIGYKICEAYFNQQVDKQKAIADILNIKDPVAFARDSGYLTEYWK